MSGTLHRQPARMIHRKTFTVDRALVELAHENHAVDEELHALESDDDLGRDTDDDLIIEFPHPDDEYAATS